MFTFALLMLSVGLHSPVIHPSRRMSEADFLRTCRGTLEPEDEPALEPKLSALYRAVLRHPLEVPTSRVSRRIPFQSTTCYGSPEPPSQPADGRTLESRSHRRASGPFGRGG